MTEFEIVQLLGEAGDSVNANFQFWLSSSFAVLLSFFFAGDRIVGFIKWSVVALYTASSILFSIRLFVAGVQSQIYVQMLEDVGSNTVVLSSGINSFIGLLYLIILLIGTITTIYFGLNSRKIAS